MPRINELGELRRTAVVSTFGPGAIVDFRAGDAPISAVVAGLEEWDRRARPAGLANPQTVHEPRLERQLGVAGFRLPPVYPDGDENERRALVAARFPAWLQCPSCNELKYASRWNKQPGKAARTCGRCTSAEPGQRPVYAVPVRFICACEKGHLQDFPWHFWVNHKEDCELRERATLTLKSEAAGLAGLRLRCKSCGASRSMEGVFSKKALSGVSCRGRRPWLASHEETCDDETPRVLQRGASNLYFPVTRSALDIPPWSDSIQRALGQFWHPLTTVDNPDERAQFIRTIYPTLGYDRVSVEQLIRKVEDRLQILERGDDDNLRWDEYLKFTSGEPTDEDEESEFDIRPVAVPASLTSLFEHLVRAVRLREVRAIRGFTRIYPPSSAEGEDRADVAPIQLGRLNWLPAVEVRGEGVFLALNGPALSDWEQQEWAKERAAILDERYRAEWIERNGADENPERTITARFLLIHTFAHVLMKELAIDCGYSSAALRERLYVGERPTDMAGLLIYTASSDSDGTLGGLARQGRPGRIEDLVRRAIAKARWCSSDPLCVADMAAASEALNLAACHSCVLASETSCEEYNRFLDRRLLTDAVHGFFRSLS
jgi:hypothetical protein